MSDFSETIQYIYNACDPLKPATPQFYVDCSDVRGSGHLAQECINRLRMANSPVHVLFTGHIGCGKSSELAHLESKLDAAIPTTVEKRYFVVRLDTQEYLDDYDVSPSDLLLMIVAELAAVLHEKAKIELQDSYFSRKFQELIEFFKSEVETESVEIPIWQAKVKLKFLRSDPTNRARVRDTLRTQTTTLLMEINTLLLKAKVELKKKQYDEIVLILDNLEKIQQVEGDTAGDESHQALFIENAPMLTRFDVHTIYTIPLTLARSHGTELGALYGRPPVVLPMVKVYERDGVSRYDKGWHRIEELIQMRLRGNTLNAVFEPAALEWLIRFSGGHIRQLMQFVQNACLNTTHLPVSLEAARQALRPAIETYSTTMRASWWEKLAKLHLSPGQEIDNNDPDFQEMLRQIVVLEYVNGGDESDFFSSVTPWYAVHPIVRELKPFKEAVSRLTAPSTS